MKRLDLWRAKLKVAKVEQNQRQKEFNQMARAFERAIENVTKIEAKIEKAKLAQPE